MWRLLKRAVLGAAGMTVATYATPAIAQAVYCTNCASEVTQLLNLARLVDQLATQGSILQTTNNQFLSMTVNTTPLSSLQWGTGQSNIVSLNSILLRERQSDERLWPKIQRLHHLFGRPAHKRRRGGKKPAMVERCECERSVHAQGRQSSVHTNPRRRAGDDLRP